MIHERIWLQIDEEETGAGEVTWCQDRVLPDDVEYVRADVVARLTESLKRETNLNIDAMHDATAPLLCRAETAEHEIEDLRSRLESSESLRQDAYRAVERARAEARQNDVSLTNIIGGYKEALDEAEAERDRYASACIEHSEIADEATHRADRSAAVLEAAREWAEAWAEFERTQDARRLLRAGVALRAAVLAARGEE